MTRKTIFEWAELFQEDISNGASQSNIIQMLEDYKTELLTIPFVVGQSEQLKAKNDFCWKKDKGVCSCLERCQKPSGSF